MASIANFICTPRQLIVRSRQGLERAGIDRDLGYGRERERERKRERERERERERGGRKGGGGGRGAVSFLVLPARCASLPCYPCVTVSVVGTLISDNFPPLLPPPPPPPPPGGSAPSSVQRGVHHFCLTVCLSVFSSGMYLSAVFITSVCPPFQAECVCVCLSSRTCLCLSVVSTECVCVCLSFQAECVCLSRFSSGLVLI